MPLPEVFEERLLGDITVCGESLTTDGSRDGEGVALNSELQCAILLVGESMADPSEVVIEVGWQA